MILTRTAILSMVSGICVAVGAAADPSSRLSHSDLEPRASSCSSKIDLGDLWSPQSPKLFDKFSALRSDDEKARLDNFAVELQADPRAVGFIIVFYQRGKSPASVKKNQASAKKRADNAKDYLKHYRGMDDSRLVSWDHCSRARVEYELWVVSNKEDFEKRYQKGCRLPASGK